LAKNNLTFFHGALLFLILSDDNSPHTNLGISSLVSACHDTTVNVPDGASGVFDVCMVMLSDCLIDKIVNVNRLDLDGPNLYFRCKRPMHWTAIANFQQSFALGLVQISFEMDLAVDYVDSHLPLKCIRQTDNDKTVMQQGNMERQYCGFLSPMLGCTAGEHTADLSD
jgi:hypothetical protein